MNIGKTRKTRAQVVARQRLPFKITADQHLISWQVSPEKHCIVLSNGCLQRTGFPFKEDGHRGGRRLPRIFKVGQEMPSFKMVLDMN